MLGWESFRRHAHFTMKALNGLGRFEHVRREHFESHLAEHAPVLGPEDRPHPSLPELVKNDVVTQRRAALQGRHRAGFPSRRRVPPPCRRRYLTPIRSC